MVTRTARFIGVAYSTGTTATVQVDYNNTVVYSGNLPAVTVDVLPVNHPLTYDEWAQILFTFTTDTDTTGQIPMSIAVTNGILFFGDVMMNYSKNANYEPDPNDPAKPIITPVPPIDGWGFVNTTTETTDGVSNCKKNGAEWDWRVDVGSQVGKWAYPVAAGQTFTFDYFVDPSKIVLNPYVAPA